MGFHPEWPEIAAWIGRSKTLLIKKLARNDCSWADDRKNGHQNGFFIPREIAESPFFPKLVNKNPEKPHILERTYPTLWPSSGETKLSTIKYYSLRNPGVPGKEKPRYEWQHTGVPKEQFQDLSPASLLIAGVLDTIDDLKHWFIVIDSLSEEAELLESIFSLPSDFHFGLFDPDVARRTASDDRQLIAELNEALAKGTLTQHAARHRPPSPEELAALAQKAWCKANRVTSLNPYELPAPGDALMSISRDIEFQLYKQAELRQRASQALAVLTAEVDLASSLVQGFRSLDQIFLSAAQTRKSRAGLSFEHHVRRMLVDGRVRHQSQTPVDGRRPDFILPTVEALAAMKVDALILSLKTTLRERWKQLGLERRQGVVFLATVDDRVSKSAVKEMAENDIVLVVPESLKKSKEAVYSEFADVITFRQFFHDEIRAKRPDLIESSS